MFIRIAYWMLLVGGLLIMIGAIMNYYKLIKDSEMTSKKCDKLQALLNIVISSFYLILGILLIMSKIPGQYASIFFIIIFLLEKLVEKIFKYIRKHKKIN